MCGVGVNGKCVGWVYMVSACVVCMCGECVYGECGMYGEYVVCVCGVCICTYMVCVCVCVCVQYYHTCKGRGCRTSKTSKLAWFK